MKKLKPSEALLLEKHHESTKALRFEKKALESLRRQKALESQILGYQQKEKQREIEVLAQELETLESKLKKQSEASKEATEAVKKRLKIEGAFGYDPDSLEVMEE